MKQLASVVFLLVPLLCGALPQIGKGPLRCYQCKGRNCGYNFQHTLKPCVNAVKGDSCVTDVIDERNVIRGCKSDPNFVPSKFTAMCVTPGCNNHPITHSAECISCSEANSTTCSTSGLKACSTVENKNTCKDIALLNRPTHCFTYHDASNKVVRGCSKDAGHFALDKAKYRLCEGRLCNNNDCAINCVKCNSKTNPKCANQANELNPELCNNAIACFVARTSDGATVRGCGEDFAGATPISSCYEDGCISELPPTSGACIGADCNKHTQAPDTSCKGDNCKTDTPTNPRVNCHGNDCKKNTQTIPRPSCREADCNISTQLYPVISVNGEHNLVIIFD